MQGGTSENSKTLEFGLDVSRLLGFVESGEEAKYFLMIQNGKK